MRFSHFLVLMFVVSASGVPAGRAAALSPQQSETGCTLRIHIDGLRNSKGVVGAAIFKSPDGWPEDTSKALHRWPTPIAPGASEATAVLDNLASGDYGIVIIHDENKNQRLDRNFVGIPKEGFGFANNPRVRLGPPPYHAAIVHVTCPVTEISIHMIYK